MFKPSTPAHGPPFFDRGNKSVPFSRWVACDAAAAFAAGAGYPCCNRRAVPAGDALGREAEASEVVSDAPPETAR